MSSLGENPPEQPEASTSASSSSRSQLCMICAAHPAIYTCPRCSARTCSLPCSNAHKQQGEGCSGVRNKAAYVPMNQYGYMALMNDYVFLEEVGRQVGEWGKEIVKGGFDARNAPRGMARGRGRGRGRGGASAASRTKRDVLKMQLDFRDIEMELLPAGMERRTMNQSTWDFKNRTALLTVEFRLHPPPDPLAASSAPTQPPYRLVTHRNSLESPLITILQSQIGDRSKKKDSPPSWLNSLVFPDPDDPEAFVAPTCVMLTTFDPLASVRPHSSGLQPGSIVSSAYHRLDPNLPLASVLKHKTFVEFPTIEVWAEGTFKGTLVDDTGTLLRGEDTSSPTRKRRKLNVAQSKKAMTGLLGGYGSEVEEGEEDVEEKNVLKLLDGYPGSDEEARVEGTGASEQYDDGLVDEDAEGETDDEAEPDAQHLATLLERLRQSGALRDDVLAPAEDEDDEVDWGDYEDIVDDTVT